MIRAIALAALLFALPSAPANAVATCALSSTAAAFGVFSGSQLTTGGTISVHCTGSGTSNYRITLSTGGSGTYSLRRMSNGANSLAYNLYLDAARTQIWGDGTGGTTFPTGQIKLSPPPSIDFDLTVFGSLPAQAIPLSGTYSDSVVATLTCTSGGNCTTTISIPITVNVQPACAISATNLSFGDYTGAQLDGQSQISLTCGNGTPWNVGLDQGIFPGATVISRQMTGPSPFSLAYSLYQDAARTLNWGNTVGVDTVSGTGSGSLQPLSVNGRVPASQTPGPGGYSDTITATLTF